MFTRRTALALSLSGFCLPNTAFAAVAVPKANDVWTVLKNGPKQIDPLMIAMDALTRLLVLRSYQLKREVIPDLKPWFEQRQEFVSGKIFVEVQSFAFSAEATDIIEKSGEQARPTAERIQKELGQGGLVPGSQLEKSMSESFIIFSQIKALQERKAKPSKEAWYCHVYPFSWFCTAAG